MQQAEKSIACGTQASSCFCGRLPLTGQPWLCALNQHAAALCLEALKGMGRRGYRPRFDTHGAAGAVNRPAFRTSLLGKTDER
jgi:hypothetical protein